MAKTPKIRFKNFSDEWENNNLGEICKIIKGEQINKLSLLENGKYYVLNGGISPSGYINTYNTLENTISISEGGNSCGYVKFNIEKFWSGGHNYTLNELKTKTLFLYSFLKAKQQKIMALRVGSGLPNIQKNTLSNISISIPNSEEQEKIGAFFSKLDKLISLHQSKFEKLQKIKKACLQNLFPQNNQNTPKIRFKNFSDEWVESKLKENCIYKSSNLSNSDIEKEGIYDLYDANGIIGKTKKNPQTLDYITIIKDGSGVGRVRLLPKNTAFIGTMGALQSNNCINFLYVLLQKMDFSPFVNGATIPHIYFSDYGNAINKIPKNSEEQEKIGAFFSKLDKLISLHQSKFEKLQKIKKACLQNMFV